MADITYDSRTKTSTVADGVEGIIDGSSSANVDPDTKILDASKDTEAVTLKGGQKIATLKGGTGGTTFISNSSKETFLGNTGSDTFVYIVDRSADVIGSSDNKNYLYVEGDKIILVGSTLTADAVSVVDKKDVVTFSFDGDTRSKLTVNKSSVGTQITYYVGTDSLSALDSDATVFGLSSDVTLDNKGTTLGLIPSVTSADIEVATMTATAKTITGGKATGTVNITGNDLANVIIAGAGGGSLYGGQSTKAVNDKLYGGKGSDTFVYALGDGKDIIENYDGTQDKIVLKGFTETIGNTIDKDYDKNYNFQDKGSAVVLTLNSGTTKGTLTINNPTGVVNVYDEDGNTLLSYGLELEDGISFGTGRSKLIIGKSASASDDVVVFGTYNGDDSAYESVTLSGIEEALDFDNVEVYAPKLKEIDASNATVPIHAIGHEASANILRASSLGSYLEGGYANDQFYGGKGSDTFLYKFDNSLGGGKDVITDFGNGDKLIFDSNTFSYDSDGQIYTTDSSGTLHYVSVADSGSNVVFTVDKKNSLTVKRTSDDVVVRIIDQDGKPIARYAALRPLGTTYNSSRKILTTTADFTGDLATDTDGPNSSETYTIATLDAADFGGAVQTIDAKTVNDTLSGLYVKGNASVKSTIYAPTLSSTDAGGTITYMASTLEGGTGNDNFYASNNSCIIFDATSSGKDNVYNFNESTDYIIVQNANVSNVSDSEGNTVGVTISGATFTEKGNDLVIGVDNKNSMTIKNYKFGQGVILVDESGDQYTYGNDLDSISTSSEDGYGLKYDSSKRATILADIENPSPTMSAVYNINISSMKTKVVDLSLLQKANCSDALASIVGNDLGNVIKVANVGDFHANTIESGYGSDQIYLSAYNGGDTVALGDEEYTLNASSTNFYYVGGKDVVYNYNPNKDRILLGSSSIDAVNDTSLTANSFSEKGDDIIVTFDKDNTITLKNAVQYLESGITVGAFEYSNSLPSGLRYNSNKTAIEVNKASLFNSTYSDTTIEIDLADTSAYVSTVKKVDLSGTTPYVVLHGVASSIANELYAGNGGSELYGGAGDSEKPSADKLFGGKGSDTFIWNPGDGNDVIGDGKNSVYGAGEEDTISIGSDFWVTDSGNQVIVQSPDSTDKLTINKAKGDGTVTFSNGYVHGVKPTGSSYDNAKSKTKLTVSTTTAQANNETLSIEADYIATTLKEIDASRATAELSIIGNGNNNSIRGGKTASTLRGGYARTPLGAYSKETNDTLIGGDGSDTFIYHFVNEQDYNSDGTIVGEGADVLYNVGTEDVIDLGLPEDYDPSDLVFTDSNNKVTIKYTDTETNKSTTLTVFKKNTNDYLNFGDFTYGELPSNSSLDSGKTTLYVGSSDAETINLAWVASTLKKMNASTATGNLYVTGVENVTEVTLGAGVSSYYSTDANETITGGTGQDIIYYKGGKDVIKNFNSSEQEDYIVLESAPASVTADGTNVVLTLDSKNNLTLSGGITSDTAVAIQIGSGDDASPVNYYFASNLKNAKWDSADFTVGGSSSEFAADGYWFDSDPNAEQVSDAQLQSILPIENNQIDLSANFDMDQFKTASNIIAQSSARHRQVK